MIPKAQGPGPCAEGIARRIEGRMPAGERFIPRAARMRAAALLAAGLLAACAPVDPPCPAGTDPATVVEAWFGRNVRGRAPVSEAEWRAFLADTETPAFPDGLSVLDGGGQWRGPDGRTIGEDSKLLVLVLPGASLAEARERLRPVEAAWTARFQQDSVLTVYRRACAGM